MLGSFAPIVLATLLPLTVSAPAARTDPRAHPRESIVHAFSGGDRAGQEPIGSLLPASDGALYGTTELGSNSTCSLSFGIGCGVVVRRPPATHGYAATILHRFLGPPSDGLHPQGALIADASGTLYGTTSAGGANSCFDMGLLGCGAVFKLTPTGKHYVEQLVYSFGASTDDGGAAAGRTDNLDNAGALYAATEFGGDSGLGAVVKLTPGKAGYSETVIFSFATSTTGYYPLGGLIVDGSGALYGTTLSGGSPECGPAHAGCGAVFKLTPTPSGTYTETVLYGFLGGNDGAYPQAGLVADPSGALYGTTTSGGSTTACSQPPDDVGCGTVFKLTPNGTGYTEHILHAFQGTADGAAPLAGVLVTRVGAVYGTASQGGSLTCASAAGSGCGTFFKLTPSGKRYAFVVLHAFQGGRDGATPEAPAIDANGTVFGTTAFGGGSKLCGGNGSIRFGCGTVFSLQP